MTAITYALYENVLDKILYVDESLALLFARVGQRLADDGGLLFVNDEYRGQFLARLNDADERGAEACAGAFKYLDDAMAERLAWAYEQGGQSVEAVARMEAAERTANERNRILSVLQNEECYDVGFFGRILFALGSVERGVFKRESRQSDWSLYLHDGQSLIKEAAKRGNADARLFMAEYCLFCRSYSDAADYIYSLRDANKRAAAILLECFQKCQPGELDHLKWLDRDSDSEGGSESCE